MTSSDAVRIASRAIALYLFIAAATSAIGILASAANLIQLTQSVMSTLSGSSVSRGLNISVMLLASEILQIGLNVAIGLWLYRCGPQLQKFFGLTEPQ